MAVQGCKALAGLLLLALVVGGLLQVRVDTGVESFLPEGESSVAALDEQAKDFGGEAVVVLLESERPRQLLTEQKVFEKLFALEGKMSSLSGVRSAYGPATVLNQIAISAQGLLTRISGARDGLRFRAEAEARKSGATKAEVEAAGKRAVDGFERRYGSLLVQGMDAGLPTLRNAKFIKSVLFDSSGSPRPRWHYIVPATDTVAVMVRPSPGLDQAEAGELTSQIHRVIDEADLPVERVTVTGVPTVLADLSDQMHTELPLLAGLAGLLLVLRFLLVPGHDTWRRRLLPLVSAGIGAAVTMAVLGWAGISLSLGAAALLPLLLGIGSSFPLYLSARQNPRRVMVSGLASVAAFASLGLSPLPFVQQLGLALAVGVLFTLAASFWIIRFAPVVAVEEKVARPQTRRPNAAPVRWPATAAVLGLLVAFAATGWWTLGNMPVSADPRDLARGLDGLEQAAHAEDVLGSSGEINVVLTGDDVATPAALGWARQVQQELVLEHGDQVRPALGVPQTLEFLGEDPSKQEVKAGLDLLPTYVTDSVITPDRTRMQLVLGLQLQGLEDQAELIEDVEQIVSDPPAGTEAEVVGLPVAAADAYELVNADRYLPNLAGVLAAAAVLGLGLRRRADGARALLAALLATGWVIGLLAMLGMTLTPLSLAMGSLTTVTASEFYVLMADARRRRSRSMTRLVVWAAVTSAIGYLVLAVSSLAVLREFGLVLTVSVGLSMLAAAVLVRLLPGHDPVDPDPDSEPEPRATIRTLKGVSA